MSDKQKSRQARILRRRLMLHTAAVWAIYSVAFVVLAFLAGTFLVPRIANFIVDHTATTIDYDAHYYLDNIGTDNLLNQLMRHLDDEGVDYSLILYDDAGITAAEDFDSSDQDDVSQSDASDDGITEAADADFSDRSDSSNAASDMNRPIGMIEFLDVPGYGADAYIEPIVITPAYLAQSAIERDIAEVMSQSGDWQMMQVPESDDGLKSYQVRDLSLYNKVKQLKVPIAVVLYLIGCLVIIALAMRRAIGYFDQLASAVADIITDRQNPVRLPRELSLTQNELNIIRLEALNDERVARNAEERKNELVAYLAHDIRTPLTSIIGYLSMLDESPDLPEEQRRRFTHTAFAKAESLEGLIDEFFEITRYNLQSIPLERSRVDARLMLQQIADEFLPQAKSRNVRIQVSTPEDAMLFVDAAKLARALENVLRNAITYADEGTDVELSVRNLSCPETNGSCGSDVRADSSECETAEDALSLNEDSESAAADAGWEITVTDTGREISDVHLESIFEKFYREDAARSTGGAGLGLAIAKEIVVAHGGSISAASCNGKTTFTITLPR